MYICLLIYLLLNPAIMSLWLCIYTCRHLKPLTHWLLCCAPPFLFSCIWCLFFEDGASYVLRIQRPRVHLLQCFCLWSQRAVGILDFSRNTSKQAQPKYKSFERKGLSMTNLLQCWPVQQNLALQLPKTEPVYVAKGRKLTAAAVRHLRVAKGPKHHWHMQHMHQEVRMMIWST